MFLVFAAQRPDHNVMPMQLRANLGNRLILRVGSEGTSEIALGERGAELEWHDPWVTTLRDYDHVRHVEELSAASLAGVDCALIVTAHENVDYAALLASVPCVVDTRDALHGIQSDKIVRL